MNLPQNPVDPMIEADPVLPSRTQSLILTPGRNPMPALRSLGLTAPETTYVRQSPCAGCRKPVPALLTRGTTPPGLGLTWCPRCAIVSQRTRVGGASLATPPIPNAKFDPGADPRSSR